MGGHTVCIMLSSTVSPKGGSFPALKSPEAFLIKLPSLTASQYKEVELFHQVYIILDTVKDAF